MTDVNYSGKQLDVAFDVYALRTFALQAIDGSIVLPPSVMRMIGGGGNRISSLGYYQGSLGFPPACGCPICKTAISRRYDDDHFFARYSRELRLTSVAKGGRYWENGVCKAKCLAYPALLARNDIPAHDEAPHMDCGCGIYGTFSLEWLESQYPAEVAGVITVIAAEGRTIVGDRGLRTQYARVVGYWCLPELATTCHEQLGGALRFGEREALLSKYGLYGWERERPEVQEMHKMRVRTKLWDVIFGTGS